MTDKIEIWEARVCWDHASAWPEVTLLDDARDAGRALYRAGQADRYLGRYDTEESARHAAAAAAADIEAERGDRR